MPNLFEIKMVGLRDTQGRFARATEETVKAMRHEVKTLARKVVDKLKEEAPVRTGRLKRGLRFNTRLLGSRMRVHFTSEAPYTDYVIRGRGPVVARNARALRFQPVLGGPFIFRKRVGPARANPFQARAFGKLAPEPLTTVRRISGRIERAFSRR